MKSLHTLYFIFLISIVADAQELKSLSLISQVSFDDDCSDIWGYTNEDGEEFAIIGTRRHTRIFSLKNPSDPVEVLAIPGTSSLWRDIKSWDKYVYVVADQGSDGLLIVDMSRLQDSMPYHFVNPEVAVNGFPDQINRCHNLYIDDAGRAFLAGCDVGSGGVVVLDLAANPGNPEVAGWEDFRYAHDVYVHGNLMFASEINQGQAAIYDISDLTDIRLINTQKTGYSFTHNIWVSQDGNQMFTTDERSNAFVEAYDISNLQEIRLLDRFRTRDGQNTRAIPHNTHFHNDFLYTSWYTDGVIILDATRPDNLVKVAQYDTWNGQDGGFHGNWGAYPFLKSGLLILSDIDAGLFVLQPDLPRASYIEGIVVDADSTFPIANVEIDILNDDTGINITGADGSYKTGVAGSQLVRVQFSHPEYHTLIQQVATQTGEVRQLDISLERRSVVSLSGIVRSSENSEPLGNAQILIAGNNADYNASSDEGGDFELSLFAGVYDIYAAQWGYDLVELEEVDLEEGGDIEIYLDKGYRDDFLFDLGWTSEGNASSGHWVRDIPVSTTYNNRYAVGPEDLEGDVGEQCYLTGNRGGNPGTDDVDNGQVTLMSPVFDLTEYDDPIMKFSVWFFNAGGDSPPNDSLVAMITNFQDTVVLEVFKDPQGESSFWRTRSYRIQDYISPGDSMRFILETADDILFHVVEAGLDGFEIRDGQTTSTEDPLGLYSSLKIYPNPTPGEIYLDLGNIDRASSFKISVLGLDGRILHQQTVSGTSPAPIVLPNHLTPGLYLLHIRVGDTREIVTRKFIKI